uniref:Ranacyclin-E n=1 Tax=Pelophylax lessonae TaxID=45623 RepID=RACYE_PELLE|nr:RecName: Full=Ranacyclin-E [Pelophylax lessonae]
SAPRGCWTKSYPPKPCK